MEHYELEDMFGRRQRPALRPEVSYKLTRNDRSVHQYELHLSVTNEGRAMCRFWGVELELPGGAILPTAGSFHGLRMPGSRRGLELVAYRSGPSDPPIFPDETVHVGPNNYRGGHLRYKVDDRIEREFAAQSLILRVYAEHCPSRSTQLGPGDLHNF
jgi:hypothetical protein